MDFKTIIFIGPQGSGKGTQAKLFADKLGFFYWGNLPGIAPMPQ